MTTFDKFRNCITEPRCRDCEGIPGVCEAEHQSVSIPKALALDVLELLKEHENLEKRHEILVDHADTMRAMLKERNEKIVRCKDCKHWWKKNELCTHEKTMDGSVCCLEAKPDFYCGYAERR